MKKSVWIFLFAVLLPSVVLGWLALRSAEEQQIVFERRTAELYQKETDALAVTVRDTVDAERRVFGETVHRLLAKGDADALARDFTNTLTDAWEVTAVGFVINRDGKLVSPSAATASKQPELQRFLLGNGGFLTSREPAIVYNWAGDNSNIRGNKLDYGKGKSLANQSAGNSYSGGSNVVSASGMAGKDASQIGGLTAAGDGTARQGGSTGLRSAQASQEGLTQAANQTPGSVGTFDFSNLTRPPSGQKNPQAKVAPSRAIMPALEAQTPGELKKQGEGGLAAVQLKESDQPSASQTKNVAVGGGKPAWDVNGASALTHDSAEPDAPTTVGKPADKPRALAKDDESYKNAEKAIAAADTTKGLKDEIGDLDAGEKSQASARGANKEAYGRDMAPTSPQMPLPGRRKEAQSKAERFRETQSGPSPEPSPVAIAMQQTETAAPMPGPAAPMAPPAPREQALLPDQKKAEETPVAQGTMTKVSANALALNNAINRQVQPQQVLGVQGPVLSTVVPEEAEFRSLTEDGDEGMVARFAQDKLNLIFWLRPPEAPEMVFGCLVEAARFSDLWKDVLDRHHTASRGGRSSLESKPEFVLALLDDRGKPVAVQPADAGARDWKHPFVASEIGEALPHWEAALYLASPTALAESARGLWRTLAFTIAGMISIIALGGWLVVVDARRQLALAQQKTDFVSNVSHELKTPLTSIRMFAELMHDRPQPAEKQGQYLRIITVEAERLTRLINNVLDFAKIGRKRKRLEKKPLDLHALVARVWESQELHLRDAGFTTRWEAAPGRYPVLGDDDALAQVLVNLLSNAEKYSNGNKEVELHTWLDDGWVNISVLDRGMGVPSGDEKKIFESFYRAHDSLASGIQGSGLGLTLAQRIAREHGGEIKLEHREGGGSRFTLRLPLARTQEPGISDQGSGSRAFPDA